MRKIVPFIFLWMVSLPVIAQDGFHFISTKRNKISIPFRLINNLVFIPIKVNGTELNFLLDTGVSETILFSLDETNDVNLKNVEKIEIVGLGSSEIIEGLKSKGNIFEVKGMQSVNHLLYVVLDDHFNLSSHIGITVNGIIGSPFFKNNLVEIDYDNKKVNVYRENQKNRNRLEKRYSRIPIIISSQKPYVSSRVVIDSLDLEAKLLIDSGNSDPIWLFESISEKVEVPQKSFDDYLGQGLSGSVQGKRARITQFSISKFKFEQPIVSFPDSTSIQHLILEKDRLGSVGGEILKRFNVVFDYDKENLYLRKGKKFADDFSYNISGIEIMHSGMQWVTERVYFNNIVKSITPDQHKPESNPEDFKYKLELKPIYEIASIRKGSEAEKVGLQLEDIIHTVNGKPAYRYSLQDINFMLRSEDKKWIELEVMREGKVLKFKFQLINIL